MSWLKRKQKAKAKSVADGTAPVKPFRWRVQITDAVLAHALNQFGIDLAAESVACNANIVTRLAVPRVVAELVWMTSGADIERDGMNPEQFAAWLCGDAENFTAAYRALLAATALRFDGTKLARALAIGLAELTSKTDEA